MFPLHLSRLRRHELVRTVATVTAAVMAASLAAAAPVVSSLPADPLSTGSIHAADVGSRLDAAVLLARPNAGRVNLGRNMSWGSRAAADSPACHSTRPICVHWTERGDHAVPLADGDRDDIPDHVERALAATATSWATIVDRLGFRAPLGTAAHRSTVATTASTSTSPTPDGPGSPDTPHRTTHGWPTAPPTGSGTRPRSSSSTTTTAPPSSPPRPRRPTSRWLRPTSSSTPCSSRTTTARTPG